MLRRATALKRICDRQRVQNANYKKYWSYETISVLFISIMLMFLEKLKQLNNEKNRI